ncbi:MAG: hypothetical protein NZ992_04005 [Candidatus Korarchaeum sp.]|nr:hypothetical protein [Candidatus Korarchaeum sp.]MDW8035279.1 hypothetical protein [Candidatus Korarchaeum sp.]
MGPEANYKRREDLLLREIVEEFGISIVGAFQVRVERVDNRACRLLKVNLPEHNVYLLETPALMRYAISPHLSGETLMNLLSSDSDFMRAVISQFSLERFGRPLIYGKLAESMDLPYSRIEELRKFSDTVLIASLPDLNAGTLEALREEILSRGGSLRVLLAMGFLSIEDVISLDDAARSLGLDTIYISFLLLGRRTRDSEIYLYGYDIGALREGVLREVGSIVEAETLSKLFYDYPPSTDLSLTSERLSGSLEYLKSSLEKLLLLIEHPIFDSWQVENLLREAKALMREIERRGDKDKLP